MNKYTWSAKHLAFFPESLLSSYESAGWDLSDLVDVNDDVYMAFTDAPPSGKIIGVVDCMPAWIELAPPAPEQTKADAEARQTELRKNADSEITWRQDAVDEGIATDEELNDLSAWKKYRVLLMRVDTSNPEWPTMPE